MDEMLKASQAGNFQIKVSILECRQLTLETDDVPNPYIIIKVGDQIRQTSVQYDKSDLTYNESFDFLLITTLSDLKTMKILMTVWHKTSWYRSDVVIGAVSVDAYNVFDKPTHMINKAWAIVEKDGKLEAGHLNYSIIVIGESHKLMALRGEMDEDENEGGDGEQAKKRTYLKDLVQGAPPIEKKSYLLSLNIYIGEFVELPWIKEFNSKVKIIVSEGVSVESLIISNSRNPGWKEQYNIPIRSPYYITFIVVEIWYDLSGEKLLGKFVLDFNQLAKDGQLEVKWNLIYGPERGNSFMRKLKYQYKFGTEVEQHFYFGRVLTSAKWVQDDNPSNKKYPSPDVQFPDDKPYIFWLDVYELTSKTLSSSDQIIIEVQVADKVLTTKNPASYNSSLNKFYWKNEKEIRFKEQIMVLPSDIGQVPDIFIRIKRKGGYFSEDEQLAYCRFKPSDLLPNRTNVKARWQKVRMCNTEVKGDTDQNYLGLLLCSVNFFTKTESLQQRPIVIETKNFKKYKLVSIIYMANELPVITKGSLPSPVVQISFNGKSRTTKIEENNINPVFGEIMFISTFLNDCLDLSDNILMEVIDKSGMTSPVLGKTEIEVGKIQKYNSQAYLDNDLYKLARWYPLFEGTKELRAKVLATVVIVKLTKQGKEDIKLDDGRFSIWPEEHAYRLYIFIIGVRKVPSTIDLEGGFVSAEINKEPMENLEDKTEFFDRRLGNFYDNNLNVLDEISDDGFLCKKIYVSKQKQFINPMSFLVNKGTNTLLTANIDLSKYILDPNEKQNLVGKLQKKSKKKNLHFNPMPEDFFPIYLFESLPEIKRTKDNTNLYMKSIPNFPFENDEANMLIGEEVTIHIYKPEYDKKGKLKKDDGGGSYNRPEIDHEYEEDLPEEELCFRTSPLVMAGENDADANYGMIRYVLKIIKEDDPEIPQLEKDFEDNKDLFNSLREFKKMKNIFICRIYLLNVSNLHIADNSVEEAFVWIKRWDSDREFKDEKKAFQVSTGEINQSYSLQVLYPETFFATLQIYAISKVAGLIEQHDLIGETTIDLEERLFHPSYDNKLDNHKTFKQIPIESRTLYHNKQVRGAVRLWVEILPKSRDQELLPERLNALSLDNFELRLIIWNTRDIPTIDGGKIDCMVKVSFDDGDKEIEQETDVHGNCKDGCAQFNWRVVIPYKFPNNKTSILVSVYDWGLTKNDLICSNTINIKKYLSKAHRTKSVVDFPRDFLPMKLSSIALAKGNYTSGGDVELEFKLLSSGEAQSNVVGKGREEPNKDPFLETPKEGRSWLDKLAFLGDMLSGFGGMFDKLFKALKLFGILVTVMAISYVVINLITALK